MSIPIGPPTRIRIGMPEAFTRILEQLTQGETMSISSLAKITGLDRRTVGKVLDMVLDVQESLRGKEVLTDKIGNSRVFKLIRKSVEKGKEITEGGFRAGKKVLGR